MSAIAKVFDTYELLEWILLHLPWVAIVRAERVCKDWRDLIQKSSRMSKALFRVALPGPPKANYGLVNPFFLSVFDDMVDGQPPSRFLATFKELCTMYGNDEASWRKMYIFQARVTCFSFQCHTCYLQYLCNMSYMRNALDRSILSIRSSTAITLGDIADDVLSHCDTVAGHAEADPGRLGEHIDRTGFLVYRCGAGFSRPEPCITGWQLLEALNGYKDIDSGPAFPYTKLLVSTTDQESSDDDQESSNEDEDNEESSDADDENDEENSDADDDETPFRLFHERGQAEESAESVG